MLPQALIATAKNFLAQQWRAWFVVQVHGDSMSPTYHDGDRVLARTNRPTVIATGDVVVFRCKISPVQASDRSPAMLMKRVAAKAGDPIPLAMQSACGTGRVPRGLFLVAGDAKSSLGSTQIGFVDSSDVLGVVKTRPLNASSYRNKAGRRPARGQVEGSAELPGRAADARTSHRRVEPR